MIRIGALIDTLTEVPSGIPIEGMKPCEIFIGAVGRIWVVEYLFIMLFEAGSSYPLVSLLCLLTHNRYVGLDSVQSRTFP
jgi:hypothetical protein